MILFGLLMAKCIRLDNFNEELEGHWHEPFTSNKFHIVKEMVE